MTTEVTNRRAVRERPEFSIPSILAAISAVISFFAGAFWGMILAIAAIVLGILGVALAAAPSIRGGIMSIIAVVAGAFGIIAAIFKIFF